MDWVYLAHEGGGGDAQIASVTALRDALATALGDAFRVAIVLRQRSPLGPAVFAPPPETLPDGERRVVLRLYPQASQRSRQIANLVKRAHDLVWWSYLDAYSAAVADSMQGLGGSVIFCAEDLDNTHKIYARDVQQSAAAAAKRAGTTYQIAYLGGTGARVGPLLQDVLASTKPPVMLVPLTFPIECVETQLMDELVAGIGVRAPVWGTYPALVTSFVELVHRCLSDDD